jgi:RNA recognition motif-containing protein
LTRLAVKQLPYDTTEFDVRDLFEEIGEVLGVELTGDHLTGHPAQIAFVDVATENQAMEAIRHLNHREVRGHRIVVDYS